MSWGHDEYLYHIVKDYLPDEALAMIRYHSFYPWHKEREYTHLLDSRDREMVEVGPRLQPVRSVFEGRRAS